MKTRHLLAPTAHSVVSLKQPMQRRQAIAPLLALPLLALGGCGWVQDVDHSGVGAPATGPLPRPVRTAWVLSSGGPRGFAHVGVLKALDELKLRPDLVVGASIGALVACLYASGMPIADMEKLALDFNLMSMVRPSLGNPGGEKISAVAMASMLNTMLGNRRLEQLPIAAAVVAIHQSSREVVAFTRGDAGVAVQASTAIEGTFAPVRIRGTPYVDPDLGTPMPVRVAQALGANRVLAVDVSAHEWKAPPGSERFRAGDLRKRALTEPEARAATLTLHPEIRYYVSLSQAFREHAIRVGYDDTMAQAKALRAAFAPG
ncbi:MAG: patatin-like phospholipase family protein [Rhodoferax sp.]|nr:patatin-like phospholipase family protein [Rhodoferax sp.]